LRGGRLISFKAEIREYHCAGYYDGKKKIEDERYEGKSSLDSRQKFPEAWNVPRRKKRTHRSAAHNTAKEGNIKEITHIVIFLLEDAEGAMVGW